LNDVLRCIGVSAEKARKIKGRVEMWHNILPKPCAPFIYGSRSALHGTSNRSDAGIFSLGRRDRCAAPAATGHCKPARRV
jgi:hypothetical protein